MLLVRDAFFFALGLIFGAHLLLFIVAALTTVGICLFATNLDQSLTLEVVQEADNSCIDVAGWLRKDATTGFLLFFSLISDSSTLGSLLGVRLGRGLALATLNLGNLFHVLLADTLTLLFHELLLLFGEFLTCGNLLR